MSELRKEETDVEISLESDTELRFEVGNKNESVCLQLKNGTAEIFGVELVKGRSYTFTTGAKIAVFTWQGCVLNLEPTKSKISYYVAKETPMTFYLNCHHCLEQYRQKAENNMTRGPITMVVGPKDVGKSTLCRILLNYAVRMVGLTRTPIFADLDIGQGHISIPGSIGAVVVERPASIEDGFIHVAPLVYHFGHISITENLPLFNTIITKMGKIIHERMRSNKIVNASGIIINTFGWTKDQGYRMLINIAQAFEVDIILVLDQERLYNELVRDMPSFVTITLLPKSGGVVERGRQNRIEARDARIREYFYGTPSTQLHPHSFDVKFSDLKIYRVGAPLLPDSCLPIGMKSDDYLTKLAPIQPGYNLLHHILAVSYAASTEDVLLTNVAGFICVTNVDVDRQMITVLSPQPKPLPDAILLLSEVQFIDRH